VDVRYDAVHAALMILNDVPAVITNDLDDWERDPEGLRRDSREGEGGGLLYLA